MQGMQDEEGLKEDPGPYAFPIFSLLSFLSLYRANNPIPCSQEKRLARYNDKNDKKKFMSLFFPYPAHPAYPPLSCFNFASQYAFPISSLLSFLSLYRANNLIPLLSRETTSTIQR